MNARLLRVNTPPSKAQRLGLREEILECALQLLSDNRNMINAIDHAAEMDDYIYQAVLRESIEKRKNKAYLDMESDDASLQRTARKDLEILSREEATIDPFCRAVLPLVIKVIGHQQPMLRLYVEEASALVQELAEFKRRHRTTSITEVIVKYCDWEEA
jgi:hypothetical protein